MSGCGDTGRCCDGPNCETSKGKCSCEVCSGRTWRYDNDCTPGACWTQENGVYTCIQKNPCECEYIGGEFGGAGMQCPDDPEGTKPPPPAPPTPPDPGPVYRWVCYRGIGCGAVEWICGPDVPPEKCYWSERECNARCSVSPPPPPPPPDNPCFSDANCASGVCCDGDCCPEGQVCCEGVCKSPPCGICDSCNDCSWPASRSQGSVPCSLAPCCTFPLSLTGSRSQTFTTSLPGGISWNPGYPAAIADCNTRWCVDTAVGLCFDSNANTCRFVTKTRYRLLVLNCATQSISDITTLAANGTFETVSPGTCTDGPEFPAFYTDLPPLCAAGASLSAYQQAESVVITPPESHGPGTELKALLKKVGIVASPTCSCNSRARKMDEMGIEWCESEEGMKTILGWLREESEKRGLPFVEFAAKVLVKRAIHNARRKGH